MKGLKNAWLLSCLISAAAAAQTLGGASAYNFLKLPAVPLLSAMGGANVSYNRGDLSLGTANPALFQAEQHTQLNASFNAFIAGTKAYSLTGGYHHNRSNTTFGGHIFFVDYGSLPQTDASGNVSGEFRPTEYTVQVSASKQYLERWRYGATVKFINASYQQYKSNAMAVDVGLLYFDSARNFSAGLVAKNMGVQLKTFSGEGEDLPFDLQLGITKRLEKAPLGFSFTAQHLHRFNTVYNDTAFNRDNGFGGPSSFDKVFNHFVLATHLYLGKNLELHLGYNHLRRRELSVPGSGNGLSGFSAGAYLHFSKLQVQLARSTYQRGIGYTQFGITVPINKLGGLGN